MKRISNRTWIGLMLAICLAVSAVTAGVVLSLNKSSTAQAAAPGPRPGSTQARADLNRMQALLNSGSVAKQASLLVPPMKFASGSGPVVPSGKTITIRPGTLHASGQHGTVQARLSDGTAVTLGLYSVQGHWRLYGAQAATAQTKAVTTGQPVTARLMADVTSAGRSAAEAGTYQPVILVHGFGESASNWDKSGMTDVIKKIPGARVLTFDYSKVNTQWVNNKAIGPALADYIHAVAVASGRPVIVVGFSMGGLAIRYAATTGARASDIAMDITIGTPNTGSGWGNVHDVLCGVSPAGLAVQALWFPGFCTQFQAASAMSVLNPEILTLPKLPPSVPLHAIAGDWTPVFKLLGAEVAWPLFGDGIVSLGSALDKRPGWMHDTFDTVANPFVLNDMSAFHLQLTSNRNVQVLVDRYISDYLRDHPVATPAPAVAHNTPLSLVSQYYTLINGGHFDMAWRYLSPAVQAQLGPFASWADGYSGSAATTLTEPIRTSGDQLTANLAVGSETYQGTWTTNSDVSLITSAHIIRVSPAASPSAGHYPKIIGFSGDSTNIFTVSSWSGWGTPTATATGTVMYLNCVPDCAYSTIQRPYPATVTFQFGLGGTHYVTVTEHILAGPMSGMLPGYPSPGNPNNETLMTSTWPYLQY